MRACVEGLGAFGGGGARRGGSDDVRWGAGGCNHADGWAMCDNAPITPVGLSSASGKIGRKTGRQTDSRPEGGEGATDRRRCKLAKSSCSPGHNFAMAMPLRSGEEGQGKAERGRIRNGEKRSIIDGDFGARPPPAMMLVQLPAMDAVAPPSFSLGLARFVPALPSLALLARPSTWLALLASLVILSSIRAALLYVRPPPSTAHKASVSLVALAQEAKGDKVSSSTVSTTTTTATTGSGAGTTTSNANANTTTVADIGLPTDTPQTQTTSWLWGLVKWDALPALPVVRVQGRRWGPSQQRQQQGQQQQRRGQQQQGQQAQQMQQTGRRSPGPAFDHPLPALYQTGTPVSMAKMIMSRHTFRRPTARPPPVRNSNAVQYQRRAPSMV
ncbi:hypothetical protein BDN70DRAFT_890142 [Pholiota conissans]|uniref:Uncharacterized protein n=1 Tax=Pholiota conissans TaxID=109636 RepID=A0A9P5ZC78_9AGAR|nr:hypothetical protein BDN70DRAFT_890142 [Pholiota conissans]